MRKGKLITEMSTDVELHEDKKSDNLYVVGIFSSAEITNKNNRKYPKDVLEREVNRVHEEKIDSQCLWGELGHPPNPEINPDKIAVKVENVEWRGNDLYGKAKILDTPMGNIAKTLVNEGNIGISSRALGTVNDDGYVNDDLKLVTWDLVTDPSNGPSWVNGIYEGQEFVIPDSQLPEEAVEKEKKQAQDEWVKQFWQVLDEIKKDI